MKVILKEDIEGLGKGGEIVTVKDGYARNYLIPRGLAVKATTKNLNQLRHEQEVIQRQIRKRLQHAYDLANRISETSVTIARLVGESEKLFGSVSAKDIEEALREEGIVIDKHTIMLEEPIKALGVYHVPIKLHTDIHAELKVWVVAK